MNSSNIEKTTIPAVGNSASVTIPKTLAEKYYFNEKEIIYLVET